ncbi:hypothetical protein G7Y41_06915 [Schaalia sp. ZJ405]|uniref:hypothetical protein n=1 Tax=Schaalia sp. ZJ405 TaxID=2709403 RepID=UPI0013ED98E8|nr:hypothetical protein [Schaalia sp. ZJ405]QPK80786.1 hypothetical protein G7Y41_06915 [Schaalia sp. ZJ405]
MPQHTMLIARGRLHPRGQREAERTWINVNQLNDGLRFINLIESAWRTAQAEELKPATQDRSWELCDPQWIDGNILILKAHIGYRGEPGDLHNEATGESVDDEDGNYIKRGRLRIVVAQNEGSPTTTYFFIESSHQGHLFIDLKMLIRKALKCLPSKLTFEAPYVLFSDDWFRGAELTKATIIRTSPARDLEEFSEGRGIEYEQRHTLQPKGRKIKFFAHKTRDNLSKKKVREMLELKDPPDGQEDQLQATFYRDGREKTMTVGEERTPTIREVLSKAGDPPISDEEFVRRARGWLKDFLSQDGDR